MDAVMGIGIFRVTPSIDQAELIEVKASDKKKA
jgi:hypothetical protein